MISLRRHQTDMLVTATGGPQQYTGQDMAEAHHGLNITDAAFDKVVGHLGATLEAAGADARTHRRRGRRAVAIPSVHRERVR